MTHGILSDVESSSPVDVFGAARRHDVLLHHPYDSFATSVQRFLEQAAADPHVLAIKQTLYRTSGDSPIIDALVDAAESGKQVLALIEIKARFDESANIRWARKLEHAGCHVVYGQVGLKTHCKLAMVVRDEPEGIRRYTHIGTGNYNPKTARSYEDLGLITTNEAIGEDVANLFNNLSGYSRKPSYDTLLVAPDSVRDGPGRAHPPGDHPPPGRPAGAHPAARPTRSSTRPRSTRSTSPRRRACRSSCSCAASARCAPACPASPRPSRCAPSSGRFLEHSRIFWFENGGEPEAWIGSADLMHRNLDRRVEVLVRLPNAASRDQVGRLLDLAFDPDTHAWLLHRDGSWQQNDGKVHLQESLIESQRRRGSLTARLDRWTG